MTSQLSAIQSNRNQDGNGKTDLSFLTKRGENELIEAVKSNELNKVDFLLKSGTNLNVNFKDDNQKNAAQYALEEKSFDILLLLLKADSAFPEGFKLSQVHDPECRKNLKTFIREKKDFHDGIIDNNLKLVEEFCAENKLKYYFNPQNESAVVVALKNKNFEIYAFLKSIGAESPDDAEDKAIISLDVDSKRLLANFRYFVTANDAHIHYLISKSKCKKGMGDLNEKVGKFYRSLDRIPEISPILKVIQHSDFFEIVFDFDKENVTVILPGENKEKTRGETDFIQGKVYIGAKGEGQEGLKEVLGTLAHELTHLAMQMVFQNACNPYDATDIETKNYFKNIEFFICHNIKKKTYQISEKPAEILVQAIENYKDRSVWPSELIVRVPHILARCDNGRKWLYRNASSLFNFYTDKLIPKLKVFLNNNSFMKGRRKVAFINETLGELEKLKVWSLVFKDVSDLEGIPESNSSKNITMVTTTYTLLGMINVLQRLYGNNYIDFSGNYLILEFGNLVKPPFLEIFMNYSEVSNTIVVRFLKGHKYSAKEINEGLKLLFDLLKIKPHQYIIFIADSNIKKELTLPENTLWKRISGKSFSLQNLNNESQQKILSAKIIFEGRETKIRDLIGENKVDPAALCYLNTDSFQNNYELVTGDIIEKIIEKREVFIGSETLDFATSEGYETINEKINNETFLSELIEESEEIFLINGMEGSNRENDLISYLQAEGEEREFILRESRTINTNDIKKTDKKLFFTENRFYDEDFKEFCQKNDEKRIYLIEMKVDVNNNNDNIDNNSTFILQRIYNPQLTFSRKFRKIVIDKEALINIIEKNPDQQFSITYRNEEDIPSVLNTRFDNIEVEEEDFKSGNGDENHWFHIENKNLVCWKYSPSSLEILREYIDTNTEEEFQEEDLIKELEGKRAIIFADEEGTGKSTTLNKLLKTKLIADNYWIIKINQRELLTNQKFKKFSEIDKDFRPEDETKMISQRECLIDLLKQMKPKLKTAESFLKMALNPKQNFPRCPLFVFDGIEKSFNEGLERNLLFLLKFLRERTKCKIWVTTRMQHKEILENELSTFAYSFIPLNEDVEDFIKKFYQDRFQLMFDLEKNRELFEMQKRQRTNVYTGIKTSFLHSAENSKKIPQQLISFLKDSF